MSEVSANEKAMILGIINGICDKTRLSKVDFKTPISEMNEASSAITWTLSLKEENVNYFKFTIAGRRATVEKFPVLNKTTSHKFIIETVTESSAISNAIVLQGIAWVNGINKIRELSRDWDDLFGTDNKSKDENNNVDSNLETLLEEKEIVSIRLLLNNLNTLISESSDLNDEIREQSKKLNAEINEKLDNKPTNKTKQYIGQIILEFIKQSIINPSFRAEIARILYVAMDSVTDYSRELANPIIALLSE